nr:immunoglobulin heavy chain junction region [Macaca mulatta]MOW46110.1 immunoglobulin heavy chain junction region [Macaca mulatta]MOW47096.1 immunoglobulin heavy chain junction region [Macaca mulatta]MOW47332.1 immunoglobulin heavy chain junction region [Macaca mulatta]MOW47563.1 immunoglobulin heavy chain junction region [Macaca mulatta]
CATYLYYYDNGYYNGDYFDYW